MCFPSLANPRTTMGVSSLTSLSSLRHARFVSGSISSLHSGLSPYFSAIHSALSNENLGAISAPTVRSRIAFKNLQEGVTPYKAKGAAQESGSPRDSLIGLTLALHRYLCILVELCFRSTPIRYSGLRLRNLPSAQTVGSPARYACGRRAVRLRQVADHRRARVARDNPSLRLPPQPNTLEVLTVLN